MPDAVPPLVMVLVVFAAFAAGWVDAVVGGGGLIQLPVLLLLPGVAPVQAAATNKLSSSCGTAVSAATYATRVPPEDRPRPGTALPMAAVAAAGALAGAAGAASLPAGVFGPVILVALALVGLYTLLNPGAGAVTAPRHTGSRHLLVALAVAALIGAYDGLVGPGTGSFLVIALVALLGYGFLAASATAKVVNLATNVAALTVFAIEGSVLWRLGVLMGAANLAGGYLGARGAVRRGSPFVRGVFLLVVAALLIRLGWQQAARLG